MSEIVDSLLLFLKKPVFEEDQNTDINYRKKVFFKILIYALVVNIGLSLVIGLLEPVFGFDLGKHAIGDALEKYSLPFLCFAAVVLAPVSEELLFRGPMIFFKDKPYFKFIFWALTLVFGFYHITNFEITTTILILAPLLVLPQIVVGAMLGFIRVRLGLLWAIGLHATYNLILLGPLLLATALDLPIPTE
ncbi:CPBP family intramembrane metalloprotease [Aurantibacter crassamenti]|uniref:CPBP family intramembrane glutamic endopeptidase n=1 Tax=Aurantibacter crassamenti TaxID=1837375 RepID=UPI0019397819|nr:CPBP family intramembrane glutamic endopeptidase [Aurantibacter crassamenti]MBM1106890.1 CPBP family intramembrane metalloprotease [Aurantibacter crassamenti]